MRNHLSVTLVKGGHIWLKLSKKLYSLMYCLSLFTQSISFPKQAPYKGFPSWSLELLPCWAAILNHCWHSSATTPYNKSASYTSYIHVTSPPLAPDLHQYCEHQLEKQSRSNSLRSPVLLGLLATRNVDIQPWNLILYTVKWYFLVR